MINQKKTELLINRGFSDKEVAEEVGCHPQSIKQYRLKMGISNSRKLDYEIIDVLIYINENDSEVAELVKCAPATIALRRSKLGLNKKYREYASGRSGVKYYPDVVNAIIEKLRKEYEIKGDFKEWMKTHRSEIGEFLSSEQ